MRISMLLCKEGVKLIVQLRDEKVAGRIGRMRRIGMQVEMNGMILAENKKRVMAMGYGIHVD